MFACKVRSVGMAGTLGLVLAVAATPAIATVFTSVTAGNWSNTATWGGSSYPQAATDTVIINHSVTLDLSPAAAIAKVTIGSGGTFTCSGAWSLQINGGWTNNGTASITNGYVFFVGSQTDTIGGTTATSFYRVVVNKTDSIYKVVQAQNVTMSYAGNAALSIYQGEYVTNGKNLTVSSGYVAGSSPDRGRLTINGGSQVTISNLYQWSLRYVTVNDSAVVNLGTHQIANSGHRFDVRRGTVTYTGTGASQNLGLWTNNSGWGWFATGGTITFNGSISSGNLNTHLRASDSAVVKFAGSANSTVNLNAWATAPTNSWWFNDLRIEKTGSASVSFYGSGTYAMDSLVRAQTGVTVRSGAVLFLCGLFASGKGYSLAAVTNNGTVNDSAAAYVAGNFSGTGTFNGYNSAVTFDGTGSRTVAMGGGAFYNLVAAKTSGNTLSAASNLAVANSFSTTSGTFTLGKKTLTLGTASASGTASIASGATFSAVGGSDTSATVTAASAGFPYAFTVASGGTIGAKYAQFSRMDTNGINVAGSVDVTNDFSYSSFDHGSTAGKMLKVENTQTLDNMSDVSFTGSAGYNIEKLGSSGHITVTGGGGSRWGESYENDPNSKVDWHVPDAGVKRIIVPSGAIAENATVFPSLKVANYSAFPISARARLILLRGGSVIYDTTETGITIAANDSATRTFTKTWLATPAGTNYTAIALTVMPGDPNPGNDSARSSFSVVKPDMGVLRIVAPTGSYDTSAVIRPSAWIKNFGLIPSGVKVLFRIDTALARPPVYLDSFGQSGIPSGETLLVNFPI